MKAYGDKKVNIITYKNIYKAAGIDMLIWIHFHPWLTPNTQDIQSHLEMEIMYCAISFSNEQH